MVDRLMDLAERCEAAEGPDRAIDLRIAQLSFHKNPVPQGSELEGDTAWKGGLGMRVQSYTASIDAAMTLVREGAKVTTQTFGGPGPMALVEPNERFTGAATLPLALCAAALRARASV